MKTRPVKVVVQCQGAPECNSASLLYKGKTVALVECDMHTKWCGVTATICGPVVRVKDKFKCIGTPSVYLDLIEGSQHPHKSKKGWTIIEFPTFEGWRIWAIEVQRYTLKIAFRKYMEKCVWPNGRL